MSSLKRKIDCLIKLIFNVETFLNNVVDKDVQCIFYPMNLMQVLVLNPKYRIKNNYIKPNGCFNKFILILAMVICLGISVYRITDTLFDENLRRYGTINFLYFASFFDFFYYSLGFILNFIINFKQTKKIVTFVLSFQEVHRVLNNETATKRCVIRNWIYVVMSFGFYFITLIILPSVFKNNILYIDFNFNLLCYVVLDTNPIYAISFIKLLTDKVKLWNIQISLSPQNLGDEKIYQAYLQIFRCYQIYKNIFQEVVLFQTVEVFFRFLVNVQVMIEFGKVFLEHDPRLSLLLYLWMIKTLIIHLTLSLEVQAFNSAMEHGKYSCEKILAANSLGDQKQFCKNVLRLYRSSFTKMSACGMFFIDICQPLRLILLITHYIVVLLQFAIL